VDALQGRIEEIAEASELLRPHYPEADDRELGFRASCLRHERDQLGKYPSTEELAARAAEEREANEKERQRQAELDEPPPPEAA
jgi:hypothetical protein